MSVIYTTNYIVENGNDVDWQSIRRWSHTLRSVAIGTFERIKSKAFSDVRICWAERNEALCFGWASKRARWRHGKARYNLVLEPLINRRELKVSGARYGHSLMSVVCGFLEAVDDELTPAYPAPFHFEICGECWGDFRVYPHRRGASEGWRCFSCFRKEQRSKMTTTLRMEVLERDGFRCRACGRSPQTSDVELQADHIIPVSKRGETKLDNLQALCRECNRGKFDRIIPALSGGADQ